MRLAWAQAAAADFDAYLWLNDDTMLLPGALATLLHTAQDVARAVSADPARGEVRDDSPRALIAVGSTRDPDTGATTYGECCPSGALAPPVDRPREVAWSFNGNIVLVTKAAYEILGAHSAAYRHSFGDVDYGIRARRAGVPVVVAPGFLGECRANGAPKWQRPEVPLVERWRALRGPKGISALQLRHLMRVQGKGVWWLSMARLYCMAIAPRWFARRRPSS